MKRVGNSGLVASSIRTLGEVVLFKPRTCEEAVETLSSAPTPVALVAGATDICAQCNEGSDFSSLIDLRFIPQLKVVELDSRELRIGSMVSLFELGCNPNLSATLPGLAMAFRSIANPRVRFRATIGGNIMARRTRYEASLLLAAVQAELIFECPTGTNRMAIKEFLRAGPPPQALLVYVAIPIGHWKSFGYDRSLRPVMTLAFAVGQDDGKPIAQAVVATEYLVPTALTVEVPKNINHTSVKEVAEAAFGALPSDYADAVASNWYIRTAGIAMLARKLEALPHED